MQKHKSEPKTIGEAIKLQRIFPCKRWSYRLNREVSNGWSNHLRGDLSENLATKSEAFRDLHERSFKEEDKSREEFALSTELIQDFFSRGSSYIGYESLGEIDKNPEKALRKARALISQEDHPLTESVITYCKGKLDLLF